MLAWLIPGGPLLSAVSAFGALFVRFVTSTIGMIVIASLIAYGVGHHQAVKKCNAERLASQLAAAKADTVAADKAADLAQDQAAELEASDRANQEKVNALELDLAERSRPVPGRAVPARSCGLSRGDALRLRGIR